jgi:cytochrome c oxidase assembly protein subunit 15
MMSKQNNTKKYIGVWLYTSAFMVFAMAVIGAITRLTESGLSMTEWRPLMGALPPMSEGEWLRVFGEYQKSPQYKSINAGMSLDEFKNIFFWEWFHRLWGRLIGLVYALPLLYFWLSKKIPAGYGLKFLGLLILGGAQGLLGWYMVKSGLVDRPSVSHYRLAAHLSLAFILFFLLFKTAQNFVSLPSFLYPKPKKTDEKTFKTAKIYRILSGKLIALTIIWGAFVAGLDAGLIYNEFPYMGGAFFPSDGAALSPFWLNFFENHATVQFTHRWLAMTTAVMIIAYCFTVRHFALLFMICLQISLGIATLISVVAIPVAAMHQAGALIVLALLTLPYRKTTSAVSS